MDERELWVIKDEAYMRGYWDGRKHMADAIRSDINKRLVIDLQDNTGAKKQKH